jgi:hypothetical protein
MITQKILLRRSFDVSIPREKVYGSGIVRIISLWLLPVFSASLVFYILFSKYNGITQIPPAEILAWAFFLIYASGVFVFLFFNHLRSERETKLIITGKTYQLIQGELIYSWRYEQIVEIIEYSTGFLPWSLLMKWKIRTGDNVFFISSLTISSSAFENHFRNKIRRRQVLFPKM